MVRGRVRGRGWIRGVVQSSGRDFPAGPGEGPGEGSVGRSR